MLTWKRRGRWDWLSPDWDDTQKKVKRRKRAMGSEAACGLPSLSRLSARELPFGCKMPGAWHSEWPHKSPSLASAAREQSDKEIIMSLIWLRLPGISAFCCGGVTKMCFDIKDVTAAQPYRRRHRRDRACVCEGGFSRGSKERIEPQWVNRDQRLRCGGALVCAWTCVCVFVCVWKLRGKSKGATRCHRLLHLKAQFVLEWKTFHVFAPSSVNNF